MRQFCEESLGLAVLKQSKVGAFVEYELPNRQRFEVFGPRSRSFHLHSNPVVAFSVEDIDEARRHVREGGAELLTRTAKSAADAHWFYFRGPDGNVYECQQWFV
jgi:hypothetical protein